MTLWEKIRDAVERIWHCEIRKHHHVKMDSHGHCYRCGRKRPPP
jgi:hypothetical protein